MEEGLLCNQSKCRNHKRFFSGPVVMLCMPIAYVRANQMHVGEHSAGAIRTCKLPGGYARLATAVQKMAGAHRQLHRRAITPRLQILSCREASGTGKPKYFSSSVLLSFKQLT